MRRAPLVVAGLLLAVAAVVALLPFRASTTVRQSGWFSYAPEEPVAPARPVRVAGDCLPPLVEAWPSGRDEVRAVTEERQVMRYDAVGGRLRRSCDAPAARRLMLSAGLLVPAGLLIALSVGRRRRPEARATSR